MGDMRLSDGNTADIPAAPRAAAAAVPPASPASSGSAASPVPAPFTAYVPQPSAPPVVPVVANAATMNQYYAQAPPPTFSRPPVSNSDPRVQDTVELCNFAILALKVGFVLFICGLCGSGIIHPFYVILLCHS